MDVESLTPLVPQPRCNIIRKNKWTLVLVVAAVAAATIAVIVLLNTAPNNNGVLPQSNPEPTTTSSNVTFPCPSNEIINKRLSDIKPAFMNSEGNKSLIWHAWAKVALDEGIVNRLQCKVQEQKCYHSIDAFQEFCENNFKYVYNTEMA